MGSSSVTSSHEWFESEQVEDDSTAALAKGQSTCAQPVPAAGVPLSTALPGDKNCSAAPPDPSGNAGHALVTIFPIVEGIALLGELDKWVNVSPNRFTNLVIGDTGLRVDLRGAVGERVRVLSLIHI